MPLFFTNFKSGMINGSELSSNVPADFPKNLQISIKEW